MKKISLLHTTIFGLLMTLLFLGPKETIAQNEKGMVIGGVNIDPSAILQLDSDDRGFLLPRMTTDERNGISSPANGLLIFNETENRLNLRANNAWTVLDKWSKNATMPGKIFYNGGNVGIGVDNPQSLLHVGFGDIRLDVGEIRSPGPLKFRADIDDDGGGNILFYNTSNINAPVLMRIDQNGTVGIGVDTPKGKLHVNGSYYGQGDVRLHAFEGDGSNGTAYIQARDDSGSSNIGLSLRVQKDGAVRDAIQINKNGNILMTPGASIIPSNTILNVINFSHSDLPSPSHNAAAYFENNSEATPTITILNGFGSSADGIGLKVFGKAQKTNGGSWEGLSDRRLKKEIRDYKCGLKEIQQIHTVSFQYNGLEDSPSENRYVGVIAQELQEIAPSMVYENKGKDLDFYLTVDPSDFTYMLINAVQEQQEQIEQKERQIQEQQSQIEALQQQFSELSSMLTQLKSEISSLENGKLK